MLYDVCLKIDLMSKDKNVTVLRESNNVLVKNNITIAKLGNAFDRFGNILKLDSLFKIYKKHGAQTADFLDGVFAFIVVDKDVEKAYIFQDRMSGNVCTYYHFDGESIMISNSMKNIVTEHKDTKWEMNEKSVEEFLDYGFVFGNQTLLYDIYKTVNGKYTEFNLKNGLISDKALKPLKIKKKATVSIPTYDKTLRQAILDCPHNKATVALSYDYDSNYILHLMRNNIPEEKEISAFNVSGIGDKKSASRVNSICKEYKNTVLHTEYVDKNILLSLPKIVYICEGAVFSDDIFKQYVLAKCMGDSDRKSIVLGDGVGEVFDFLSYSKINSLAEKLRRRFKGIKSENSVEPYTDPNDKLANLTVKKSGILMNYFDVAPFYPYLMKDIIQIAGNTVKANQPKDFHMRSAKANVSADVMHFAKKDEHPEDLTKLFSGDISEETIINIAKRSSYYETFPRNYKNSHLQTIYYLKLVYLQIFERIFASKSTEKLLGDETFNYSLKAFFPKFF